MFLTELSDLKSLVLTPIQSSDWQNLISQRSRLAYWNGEGDKDKRDANRPRINLEAATDFESFAQDQSKQIFRTA